MARLGYSCRFCRWTLGVGEVALTRGRRALRRGVGWVRTLLRSACGSLAARG